MTRIFLIVTFAIFTSGCTKEEKVVEPKSDKVEVKPEATKPVDTKEVLKDEVKEVKEEAKVETKAEVKTDTATKAPVK